MTLQDAAIAANRFGLGARPGEIRAIAGDPRGWLKAQLTPEPTLPAPLAALPSTWEDAQAFNKWIASIGLRDANGLYRKNPAGSAMGQASAMGSGAAMGAPGLPPGVSIEQSYIRTFGPGYAQAVEARMRVATATDRPYFERLVRFWGNHFTVSAAKPDIIALAPAFERDVARAHCTGAFRDMLMASCKHPAMLIYLDNYISIGPNSFLAHNPQYLPPVAREVMKGLNENLGREILELHTLGVRSGYTQADVTSLAKVITGWSVNRAATATLSGKAGESLFRFIDAAHEPGPQVVLGKTYAQSGLAQGETALIDIARNPATSRFIAGKLVRHFVADDPPPAAVERIAKVFRDTDGDLHAVSVALVDLPEAWTPGTVKMKPPEDYLTSALRAMNGKPELNGGQLIALLDRMGQRPYYATGPNGWADVEGEWIGPDALWKRVEWADALAKGIADAKVDPALVAQEALGPTLTPSTARAIKLAESPAQGMALFLTAPEFQRR